MKESRPVVIARVDLPAELRLRRQFGQPGALLRDYLPQCQKARAGVLTGAVFLHPSYLPEMALSMGFEQISALYCELDEAGGAFCLARSVKELDAALEAGKIAILLSLEGCGPLERDPSLLRGFYELGVRFLSCAGPGGELSRPGRELAKAAWRLGMTLDVSGLNDAGFAELLALGDGPVLASRSNCRALCGNPRNLTDAQLKALGARGGVIGVNQLRRFVRERDASLEDLCAHVLRVEEFAGPGGAGLGLNLARPYREALPHPRADENEDLFPDYGAVSDFAEALRAAGLSPERTDGVLGGNFLRFLRKALPETL